MVSDRPAPRFEDPLIPPEVGRVRLLAGLFQGLLLYVLYRSALDHAWPATVPPLFVALVLAGVLGPVLLVSSLGHLPRRALAGWVVGATIVAAALGGYDGWRQVIETMSVHARESLAPSAPLVLATLAGFFIAHALVLTATPNDAASPRITATSKRPGSWACNWPFPCCSWAQRGWS